MMTALQNWRDRLLGRGESACTVPLFDGALKSNQLLQQARVHCQLEAPEDLATDGQHLYVAEGAQVLRIAADGSIVQVISPGSKVTALACLPLAIGGLAVALEGTRVRVFGGICDGREWREVAGRAFRSVNTIAATETGLVVTDASAGRPVEQWRHDLMELGCSGRVCALDFNESPGRELATGLHHAFGAASQGPDGPVLVSESWRHRVVAVSRDGSNGPDPTPVLDRLPGYPSRIAPAPGGWWLTVFAARTQLVEFVLREPTYRNRMMATIDPDCWIAPQLRPARSFVEPLQAGSVKQMGVLKPWAPPRSYGLVIRLSEDGTPLYSLHSRGDGTHHGIVAAAQMNGQLYVLSKAVPGLLRIDVAAVEKELLG